MVKETEITVKEGNSPAEMIRMAVSGGADLEKLEKLLALQERWEAGEARKAYHVAMAAFKANPPRIDKDQQVAYGNTKYNHASLANVVDKISAELSKHGLSASWTTKQNGTILVTCKITHVKGHSEETTLAAAADASGSKNAIQAIGSTITYLERYTLLALTGLATYEQDDDGKAASAPVVEYIDNYQQNQVLDYINELKIDSKKFFAFMKIATLEEMPKSEFPKAIAALEAKRKAMKK
jgi:hypothetical protein